MDIKSFSKKIVFLYIRETPSSEEATGIANRFKGFDCIVGDLNLNPAVFQDKKKLITICGKTKHMLLEETTTINKTQLDHIIIEDVMTDNSFATSYHNFASYHKSIVLRITSRNNQFTKWFKQKKSFDADSHMKRKINNPEELTQKSREGELHCNAKLKILAFSNPPRSNLCFSNAVINILLNIPMLTDFLKTDIETENKSKQNVITMELINLINKPNISCQSTQRIRTFVKAKCFKAGQVTRNFNDKNQHDAGEFMTSVFEHLFKETLLPLEVDEHVFGGLFQEALRCACGMFKSLPIQKLSEIWTVQISGENMQSCLESFLNSEEVDFQCSDCGCLRTKKEINIIMEPKTLIIQLKRFEFDPIQQKILKKHDSIKCPRMITLPAGSSYTLSSVLNHIGNTPSSGHYTVTLYDDQTNLFMLLDDQSVTEHVNVPKDMYRLSYIACYVKN